MNKFVWVFGPTAVGKDTLINNIVGDSTHPFITKFGLSKPIIVDKQALTLRQNDRLKLASLIARNAPESATILIKGQGFDITDGRNIPRELETLKPESEHTYIYLDASPETLRKHREQRGESNSTDDTGARLDMLRIAKDFEREGFYIKWLTNDNDDVPVEQH